MKEFVVRICLYDSTTSTDLLNFVECLRYAGHCKTWVSDTGDTFLDLYCPQPEDHDTRAWARQKAAKLESHGFNAVSAPRQEET